MSAEKKKNSAGPRWPAGWRALLRGWLLVAPLIVALACGSHSGGSKDSLASSDESSDTGSSADQSSSSPSSGGTRNSTGGNDTGGNQPSGVSLAACGNGELEGDEDCDDGNSDDGDGCSWRCTLEPAVCGDEEQEPGEQCDDGNLANGDGCDSFCQVERSEPACADGLLEEPEECDDANLLPGDGCDDRCRIERCGNHRVDAGEDCDPPVTGECTDTCLFLSPNCGDGTVQKDEFEECDDANEEPTDGCDQCRLTCGNGRVDGNLGEQCEPVHSPYSCTEDCHWLPSCGDGAVQREAGEECDPDNGVTCVACRIVTPEPPSCNGGEAGAAGASSDHEACPEQCVPMVGGGTGADVLQNGSFDDSFAGWEPQYPALHLSLVSEGVPEPAALEITWDSWPVRAMSGATQCIPIQAGTLYDLDAQYFIPEDVPESVYANVTALLYEGTVCQGGDWVRPAHNGPTGTVRGTWTPYEYTIDTSTLLDAGITGEARMFLRLNVERPRDTVGNRVRWDTVSLHARGSSGSGSGSGSSRTCGNCEIDEGEDCDDGNEFAGDGCGPDCKAEICGDGAVQPGEQCDDGANSYGSEGDECTPDCRAPSTCDECGLSACSTLLDECWGMSGEAQAGPAAGAPRSLLCADLLSCILESSCDRVSRNTEGISGAFLENCYCGSAGDGCFSSSGQANGSCRRETEAALETTDPISILQRLGGSDDHYPIFSMVDAVLDCENDDCESECVTVPACGDGHVQDRNLDFAFVIDRQQVECRDDLTFTGRGCSFEECDDGNLVPGDGCDEHCFLEVCGNHVVQVGETCDDGNRTSGDGCSADCQGEFDCGDGEIKEPFEECDPPDSGPVCSLEEYGNDPSQCGCHSSCVYKVCGDGVLQGPDEQCDPPDGVTCGEDCQVLGSGACEDCINADESVGPYNQDVCTTDAACFAIKQCALAPVHDTDGDQVPDQNCYAQQPAECYCGIGADLVACESDNFQPTGPCAEEIRAGAGDDPTNIQVLQRFINANYPLGRAMLIVKYAGYICADDCSF